MNTDHVMSDRPRYEVNSCGVTLEMTNSVARADSVYNDCHSPRKTLYLIAVGGSKTVLKSNRP
jgi:hypothetical protein